MEYFIVANSFAAPFVSDQSESFEKAESPEKALEAFVARYSHPARLFAADCFASANDFHKDKPPLARWLCNHELEKRRATEGKEEFMSKPNIHLFTVSEPLLAYHQLEMPCGVILRNAEVKFMRSDDMRHEISLPFGMCPDCRENQPTYTGRHYEYGLVEAAEERMAMAEEQEVGAA